MYLSEEKRAELRRCFKTPVKKATKAPLNPQARLYDTEKQRKVSQILFDARDGKEVFTPF